ncbi:MAG: sugar phosphate isomerase/epimerase [Planctomycetes bacterium]|nr:sugar phosphate isomerase/epimerase [Planctomycetota bacterium]
MLSITTDYVHSDGSPEPYLRAIADAGITGLHWCHQWNTDFLYGDAELSQLRRWLDELGLFINDIHGSAGREKHWGSPQEHGRLAGLELIRNRVEMAARLGCDVVIMHFPTEPGDGVSLASYWDRMRRNLDALMPCFMERGVRLALENMAGDNCATLARVLEQYEPAFVGFCYDPGHGNIAGNGLEWLDKLKHRLIALHLNDNDGKSDLHKPLFSDTVDWPHLARLIAASAYAKPAMTMEVVIANSGISDERSFLARVVETGLRFNELVRTARNGQATSTSPAC